MRKQFVLIVLMALSAIQVLAHTGFGERPKLVVGIVVDQMRWDYLSRYYDQFQEDGLKRIVSNGCLRSLLSVIQVFIQVRLPLSMVSVAMIFSSMTKLCIVVVIRL